MTYIRRLFISDYSHAYLLCGFHKHLETHKVGIGSCYIDPDTEVLTKIYCYPDGDPFCEDPIGFVIPKSSLDTWLLKNTNKEDFAIIRHDPYAKDYLEWDRQKILAN